MGVVQLLDVFPAERAAAIQPAVDRRAKQPAVTGREFVPERVAARIGGLAMGGDLRERRRGSRHGIQMPAVGRLHELLPRRSLSRAEGSDPLSPDNVTIISTRPYPR